MTDFETLLLRLEVLPPGASLSIPKSELEELPEEFERTLLGTPTWIAHPGAVAQFRAPGAVHAYEMETRWDFHRDRRDPRTNPISHALLDAPEIPLALGAGAVAGSIAYHLLDQREKEKPVNERNWWLPLVVGLAVAAIVGFLVYVLLASVRVSLGVA